MQMQKLNREKGMLYGVRQHDKACSELVKIVEDLLPMPCKVSLEDDVIFMIFNDDIDIYNVAGMLGINPSAINYITPLTDIRHHYSIPLDFIRRN